MVRLAIKYLYEIGLVYSNNSIDKIVDIAIHLDFTHDPFDNTIVDDASVNNSILISMDKVIKQHYKNTVW